MNRARQSLALLLLFCLTTAWADAPQVAVEQLDQQPRHELATELVTHIIGSYHYKQTTLDDTLSSDIFDNYFSNLDPNRSFFTRADIDRFEPYRYRLDDALRERELDIAFEIFKVFRERVKSRVEYAISLLDEELDFSTDQRYHYDRRELPWAADETELDNIWRKRIKNDVLQLRLADREYEDISDLLKKRYQRLATSTYQLDPDDVFQTFINAYTTAIEPHTAYFSPRTSENFDISMRLSLEGIGAVLSGETDYTKVQSVVPGGPADLNGELQPDDRIIGVGQGTDGEIVDVIGWRLDDVVDLIRGPKGTIVRLEVLPKGIGPEGPRTIIELERNKINLEQQAAKAHVLELEETNATIGVIEIPAFYMDFAGHARGDDDYRSTTRDVRKLLNELDQQDVAGIVIDLRGNGGGSLAEALEFTGLFIEGGPIVQTKDSSGRVEVSHDPDPSLVYAGPLAVLVDRHSASASEIFAGAIQDYRRGIIIGEPTFGKGTVQNIIDLSRFNPDSDEDLGRLKTTIAQFFRISGGSNQYRGVIPDIVYPTANSADEHGERAFDNALPWDSVQPASYKPAFAPTEKFELARQLHEVRVENDAGFKNLLKRSAFLEQTRERKSVSLNIEQRREERDTLLEQQQQLDESFQTALGLEMDSDSAEGEENGDSPDILLKEAARILNDLIVPPDPPRLHAVQESRRQAVDPNL
jgi:carboxyl-terminal processing protease